MHSRAWPSAFLSIVTDLNSDYVLCSCWRRYSGAKTASGLRGVCLYMRSRAWPSASPCSAQPSPSPTPSSRGPAERLRPSRSLRPSLQISSSSSSSSSRVPQAARCQLAAAQGKDWHRRPRRTRSCVWAVRRLPCPRCQHLRQVSFAVHVLFAPAAQSSCTGRAADLDIALPAQLWLHRHCVAVMSCSCLWSTLLRRVSFNVNTSSAAAHSSVLCAGQSRAAFRRQATPLTGAKSPVPAAFVSAIAALGAWASADTAAAGAAHACSWAPSGLLPPPGRPPAIRLQVRPLHYRTACCSTEGRSSVAWSGMHAHLCCL